MEKISEELKYLLNLAYETTPLWREKFEAAKLKPSDINSVDELLNAAKRGLYLQPKDLYNPKILPNYISEGRIYSQFFMTSGSTGVPKIVPKTKDDVEREVIVAEEVYKNLNLEKDKILNLFPSSPAASGAISTDTLAKLNYKVNVLHIGPAFLSNPLFLEKLIEIFKPTCIFGLPTALYRLPEIIGKK